MRTIHKQSLELKEEQLITHPGQIDILHVAEQHDRIFIWYTCDPAAADQVTGIAIRGTGDQISTLNYHHIGTVLASSGAVWHVFKRL